MGTVSVFIGNGEPSGPELLGRGGGSKLVEIDGRVGSDLRAWVYVFGFLGGINGGDHLERNHSQVAPGLELNLHIRPFSGAVDSPFNPAIPSLLVRITGTRDTRVRVGGDQQSLQSNGGEEELGEHCCMNIVC